MAAPGHGWYVQPLIAPFQPYFIASGSVEEPDCATTAHCGDKLVQGLVRGLSPDGADWHAMNQFGAGHIEECQAFEWEGIPDAAGVGNWWELYKTGPASQL